MEQVLVTGDLAIFMPMFGAAIVTVLPGTLSGSASSYKVTKKVACLDGDEKKISVPTTYIAPPFVIPGMGNLKIKKLASDQLSQKTKVMGKKLMLKGQFFEAEFQVTTPAQQPAVPSPIPDATPMYSGKGQFQPTNLFVTDKG
ncbi:hypothetical protein [Candidatus Uabimicrobium sp. HlEnr_7]|uniref:hypothetical protein n=1 Tax=Candidatus Uabimicrobium helgolandensis TaxID=3095367 RepID=UPI00355931A2